MTDAIVIGAGLNGLTTAAYLARAGRRVLVLERRSVIGGSNVTEDFAPGFRCDTCLHDVGHIPPRIVRDLDLEPHGLQIVSSGSPLLAPTGTGDWLRLGGSTADSALSIRRFSQHDADRWPAFIERIAKLAGFLEASYAAPVPGIGASSFADLFTAARLGLKLRGLGKQDMVALLRYIPMSVAELLDDWFESDVLKGAIGARGITHICQGPRSAGTAFVLLHHQVGRLPGAFNATGYPLKGAEMLASALAASARAAGAEIRTGAEVAHVTTRDGHATGVVLASGEESSAKLVVSSADPRTTFLSLCDPAQLAPEFVRAVRNIRYRGIWAKVNLALDAFPDFPGAVGGEGESPSAISISPSLTYLERAYDDAKYGRVSEHPYLHVRIPTVTNPDLAPKGKHVMTVHVQYAPYRLRDGAWDDRARTALGDRVVATLAQHAPSLPGTILHRQVLTPLDLQTTFGLPEGSAYHGEMTLDQVLFMRPVPECSDHRTPVHGLWLCGAGAHPGGGIAGGAGANAARTILRARQQSS